MYVFFIFFESERIEVLFEEIFNGLHVVVRHAFDFFDAHGVLNAEIAVDVAKFFSDRGVYAGEGGQRNLAKGDKVFYFHAHAVAYERKFRKILVEALAFIAVTAVDRGNSRKFSQFHRFSMIG